jgi:hypothetical protein
MTDIRKLKTVLLACGASLALAGCFGGDSTAELAGPGNTGTNPGTGSGGGSGGGQGPGGPSTGNCPAGTAPVAVGQQTHCRLSGTINSNVTLTPGNLYQLQGTVRIGTDVGATGNAANGVSATLTVLPGVTVYGLPQSQLAVQRGSRLVANGSAAQPIIFTSANDVGVGALVGVPASEQRNPFNGSAVEDPFSHEWGGISLMGRARINTCSNGICESNAEGDAGPYGGNFDDDNSGSMQYVQLKYAGFEVPGSGGTNELNGLALWGVGRGTVLDRIHIHNGGDDNIEFFGGTVNAKRLVLTGSDDDSLDWTFGWTGRVQFVIIAQNPLQPNTDRGYEADNNEANNDALPRSNPIISNVTLVGTGTAVGDTAIILRRGTAARLYNHVIDDKWTDDGIGIQGTATFNQIAAGNIILRSFYNSAASPFENTQTATLFNTPGWNNQVGPSSLIAATAGRVEYINGPNENAVPAFDVTTVDGFFEQVDYTGAVKNSASNWTVGWTFGLN